VILNINFQDTYKAFAKLAGKDTDQIFQRFEELQVFQQFEAGAYDNEAFRQLMRREINPQLSDQEIDKAWNEMLLDIPLERIQLIQSLKEKYKVFLLSNTNQIHIQHINQILNNTCGVDDLKKLFHKAFYSYEIKTAKPGREIYDYVIKDQNLNPQETLFLDDNIDNIEGAIKAGWQTIHVTKENDIIEIIANA
jgi:putative hydrolase of the HAD superfamily